MYYIDKIDVKESIFYSDYKEELDYDSVVISTSLSKKINKGVGDSINLNFYIEDEFYTLNDIKEF